MAFKLFPTLVATAFAASLFNFFLKRRSRETNGKEANKDAAANDGTARGDSGTHTSTEVHEMATSSGTDKDAAANDETTRGDSGTHTSTEVPKMATSSGSNKDATANDGTTRGDSCTHTSTRVLKMATSVGANKDAAVNNGMARGASSSHASAEGHGMATSSGYDYEVFLSFRGPDTRARFTDFLYTSLKDVGIRTFKDDEDLRKGEEFGPELLQAINQSKISMPIFSKDYASSVWCLKELVHMVECQKTGQQKILPIFYDVAPSEVRHQTGDYGKAFCLHEKKQRYDDETMTQWKAALNAVGAINGWDLHSKIDRREGEFAKTVTHEVFNELKKPYLEVSNYLVSVDHHVNEIMNKVGAQTRKTRIIVIHGMGGVGKTTLAKIIYNQLSKDFKNCCFLSNIREMSESKGIECLQHQLISYILQMNQRGTNERVEGTHIIKCRLRTKQVLLLLDDVHEKKHMDALVGERNWFGEGSKVIITTRKKDIINFPVVDDHYEVDVMDSVQSLQLFNKHAFRRNSPLDDYIKQSNKVVDIAGGLPLALEVIGSLLSLTKKEMWDETLDKSVNVPHVDVQSKLKISFDYLDFRQQHILLDIACFFIGYEKDIVIHFWESKYYPVEAMGVLQNMSLIKITKNKEVWMHDQLRDLGREIIRQKSEMRLEKHSRVWNPEKALDLLTRQQGNEVEALRLKFDREEPYCFTYEDFRRLSYLKFLAVDGSKEKIRAEERLIWHELQSSALSTNKNTHLLPQLRWLSWCDIPLTSNITNFSMENVVILDLSRSEITHNWKGWSHMKVMKNLKVLNLTGCNHLERTPNFSALVNLERLVLRGCRKLEEIDRSIGKLTCLVSLDVRECRFLKRLPKELGGLKALEELRIDRTAIKGIPNCQGMKNLRIFTASFCWHIKLPPTVGDLATLERLSLYSCTSLKRLPDSIGNLTSLIELDIKCTSIRELPNSIGNLRNLKVVRMTCDSTSKIPNSFWTIEKLKVIEFMASYVTEGFHVEIGNCISKCQSLRILTLHNSKISVVPTLPKSLVILELEKLYVSTFPDLSHLTNLERLWLDFGPRDDDGPVEEEPMPPWIGNLRKLETLFLTSDYVTTLPTDISSLLPRLECLSICCRNLRCLLRLPSSLVRLNLTPHESFCSMDVSNLKKLSGLQIRGCAISEIRGLDRLEEVRLSLFRLQQAATLPDLSNLDKLTSLEITDCDDLVEIRAELLPQCLQELEICCCGSLRQFPPLSSLQGLRIFLIWDCDILVETPLELPRSLEEFWISSLRSLQKLPDLSSFEGLRKVVISRCDDLVEMQGELPRSLEKLGIFFCESLHTLPDLLNMEARQKINIHGCGGLIMDGHSWMASDISEEEGDEWRGWDEWMEESDAESEGEEADWEEEWDAESEGEEEELEEEWNAESEGEEGE